MGWVSKTFLDLIRVYWFLLVLSVHLSPLLPPSFPPSLPSLSSTNSGNPFAGTRPDQLKRWMQPGGGKEGWKEGRTEGQKSAVKQRTREYDDRKEKRTV